MGTYQRQDRYYRKAKERGLPSRASFKIEEILQRFPIVQPGDLVLDLGAAPGGWTVVLSKTVGAGGKVFAMDLQPLSRPPPPNVEFFRGDLSSEAAQAWLKENLKGKQLDCVGSDLAPKLTGIRFRDQAQSYELARMAFDTAEQFLKVGGNFIVKTFPGTETQEWLRKLRARFKSLKTFEPQASRKTSKEVYVVGLGFQS